MAKVKLGKDSFDLPDSCEETSDALKEAASALADYSKSGDSRKFRDSMENILKKTIPNDLKKAKSDKDAKKALDQVSKTVEKYQEAIDKEATVESKLA
jgi:hypothetical protein